jgi:[acyl-carrier-protein] S-malonyltransferase
MKLGMMFPGYGSQYAGMTKELYDESRLVQEYFEEASNCLNVNFVKLCFASSDVELSRIPDAYTANFLASSALAALLKSEGIEPSLVGGYNLGEYAAVCAVGGFTFPDGLYLLNKVSSLYQGMLPNVQVALLHVKGVSENDLARLCKKMSKRNEPVQIAVFTLPEDVVVSGHAAAIDRLQKELSEKFPSAVVEAAPLEIGLHSKLMDPVAADFAMYLEKVDFKDLRAPLVSGVDGLPFEKGDRVKQHVIDHIHQPVLWPAVVKEMVACDFLVEVGPGKRLSETVAALYPDKKVYTINTRADIELLKAALPAAQSPVEEEQKQDSTNN